MDWDHTTSCLKELIHREEALVLAGRQPSCSTPPAKMFIPALMNTNIQYLFRKISDLSYEMQLPIHVRACHPHSEILAEPGYCWFSRVNGQIQAPLARRMLEAVWQRKWTPGLASPKWFMHARYVDMNAWQHLVNPGFPAIPVQSQQPCLQRNITHFFYSLIGFIVPYF